MKAAVWYGQKDVRVIDVPEPKATPGLVKIKVTYCGICGSDLHEYLKGPIIIPSKPHPLTGKMPPVTLGHEFCGQVVETGEGVTNIKTGDRVTADACLVCHECFWCKKGQYNLCAKRGSTGLCQDGGFASYVVVPAYTCYKLPPEMSDEAGAFVEPLAVATHAVKRGRIIPGDIVAVVGSGPIGLLVMQVAKASGASKVFVVEPMESRKKLAAELGATKVYDPSQGDVGKMIHQDTDGLRADLVFECVGKPETVDFAIKLSGKGARIVIVGIFSAPAPFHFARMQAHEKELIGSSAYPNEFPAAISFLADGRVNIKPLITGKIKLNEIIEKGFNELLEHPERNIKILVSP